MAQNTVIFKYGFTFAGEQFVLKNKKLYKLLPGSAPVEVPQTRAKGFDGYQLNKISFIGLRLLKEDLVKEINLLVDISQLDATAQQQFKNM